MGKKVMAVLMMLVLAASPALASVQNVKVGGELAITSIMRNGMGGASVGGASIFQNGKQDAFISQLGLTIQADLTDNVSTDFKFINDRVWGENDAATANGAGLGLIVDTASITMKELFYSPMTVVIGRQALVYGNSFLIGSSGIGGIGAIGSITGQDNFDAIKVVLAYDPLTIDLFAAKVNEGELVSKKDTNLYGINANYQLGDKMNTVIEGYLFAKLDKYDDVAGEAVNKRYTPGMRVSVNPVEGLNLQGEFAYQFGEANQTGSYSNNGLSNVRAYAMQFMANYALSVMKDMKPVLSGSYTLYSGDRDDSDSEAKAFDSLFENQFNGRIFSDVLENSNSNLQIIHVGFEVTPIQDLTTKLSWYNLKQHKTDVGTPPAVTNNNSKIGNEFDLDVTYAYTEDVTFGVSAGMLIPTSAKYNNDDKTARQLLTSVKVAF